MAIAQRMVTAAWASWCVDATLIGLLTWWAGVTAERAFWTIAIGSTSTCGFFAVAFARRWTFGLRDRYLTVPQLLAASLVALVAAAEAPAVAVPVFGTLFVMFAFAALRLSQRDLLISWAGITLALAVVVSEASVPLALPTGTPLQAALSTIWLSLLIGRCALLGLYGATLRQRLIERGRELADATGRLHELAMRDALTGALNRRAIMAVLDDAIATAAVTGTAPAVALVDLDQFKAINDMFGHPAGDEVLRRFVTAAAGIVRGADRIGRYGGEEFLVVLPDCADRDVAGRVAERLRATFATLPWDDVADGLRVTASIGVAHASPGMSATELLSRSDRALYDAKRGGRDRVCVDGAIGHRG